MIRINLLSKLPSDLSEEHFQTLLAKPGVRVERIVSLGHASPPGFWYDQEEGEWILLLQGAARLQLEGRMIDLRSGDCIDLPAHTRHRVAWTSPTEPTIWLAVFYRE